MTDNQFQEIFRLVTNAVTGINEVKADLAETKAELKADVKNLSERVERVEEKLDGFRQETNENFRTDRREMRAFDKRESSRNKEISQIALEVEDLTARVEILEQKAA